MQKFFYYLTLYSALIAVLMISGCDDGNPLNNPHARQEKNENTRYMAFSGRPKTLDPARAYNADSSLFTAQIYEPPLQYHYLKRPYELVPLTADNVPKPYYLNLQNERLPETASIEEIAYSVYDIKIKPGTYYQPHPAFAKNAKGDYLYQDLSADAIKQYRTLYDFPQTGTRELKADDYVYEIKRLAHPAVQSPIYGLMSEHIVGMGLYAETLADAYDKLGKTQEDFFLDLRRYPLEGVEIIDDYTFRIKTIGKYAQFNYWLAMPFFAPIPWEADRFYSQPGMNQRNINFDWYPVGTGAYMLTENNPNREMVLERNPHAHEELYPSEGEPGDKAAGLLADAGKPMPFIDKVVFTLDVENIPRWNKFLQGYYDAADIKSDSFDQAVQVSDNGKADLSSSMQDKNIKLYHYVDPSIYYMGFNMLDNTVGGSAEKNRKLRQAISIAVNYEDYITIFTNGRGIVAESIVPPGVFGYREGQAGINPYVYDWIDDKAQRKPLEEAKRLLAEAGYPEGLDPETGHPLVLNLDIASVSAPDDKARFDWYRKQFDQLGIQLHIRSTHPNRYREKLRNGNVQLFMMGWLADYPDAENFLFLLNGLDGKVFYGGENLSNYNNPEYDELFKQMKYLPDGPQRQAVIDEMVAIMQKDAPLVWGYYPITYQLSHQWNRISKPGAMVNNNLKYLRFNAKQRDEKRRQWNPAIWWPIMALIGLLLLIMIPVILKYRYKEHQPKARKPLC